MSSWIQGRPGEPNRRITIARAVGATMTLGAVGSVIGAAIGAGVLAGVSYAIDGVGGFPYIGDAYTLAAFVGGALGIIAAPYAAWSLPNVAIGRIMTTTSVGTAVGGAGGFVWTELDLFGAIFGAVLGFALATTWLALRSSEMWRRSR